MRVLLEHKPEYFISESMERWNVTWKKSTEYHTLLLIISIPFLILSIFMIKASDKMGLFFFPVAIFVIVITTNFLTQAWKKKKRYIRQINEVSEKLSNQSVPTVWDLEADYFGYKDYQCETKTSWSAFSHFYVKANALHMVLHYRTESSFSISEGEVGNEMFNEIVEFVTAKIGVGVKT